MSNKTLYIIRGVPGSGKSTLAHQLTKNVVETDDFMMVDGEYKYEKDKVYACHKKCFNKVLNYMAHSVTPIAVANTFIKKKDYKPYVDLAKEFGYNVEIKVCKGDYKNVHNVPQDRVEQMKSKFQESINSLLEMNGDVGITDVIENKKQSVRIKVDESNSFLSKNVKFVTSPSQLLSILKSQNGAYRILYDKNLDMYMIGHEEEVIHQDMLEYAYKSGLYYNMEEFIESLGAFQNYIETGVSGGWDANDNEIDSYLYYMIFDPYNEWKIGDDGYDNLYKLKFGNLLTRMCDIKEIPLYNLLVSKKEINESLYDVFDPNQIKSVNNGNWSTTSNKINESKEVKLNDNFKKWFGNSKCVDENGKPLVVYHGSPNKFEIFDILKTTDNLTYGKGFYFTNDKSAGDEYAGSNGKNYACYIRLINPYIVNSPNMTHEERLKRTRIFRNKTDSRTELIKQGYDGILYEEYDEHGQYIEVVAFYPNQIKSVNNNGNWSLNSDNINESKEIKFNDNFKKWFGNSKIVDENGNPLVVYHGTPVDFNEFDKSKQKKLLKYGQGFYFTSNKQRANLYGEPKGFYLRINNPITKDTSLYFNLIEKISTELGYIENPKSIEDDIKNEKIYASSHAKANKIMIEKGYDGIILYDEYIVFNPNQIKSVDNNGNWSENSNNIYESFEPKINDNFKKWFGNSKCVDENGNPKVFIHRSNAKFNAFDKSKIGQRDHGWYGKGFYFGSEKQKDYKLYGKHVYKCFLRIENPFYYNEFFGSYHPDDYQKIIGYDKLGLLTPQESKFLKKYLEVYEHFDSNVKLKKVPQKVKGYNGKTYDSFYWVVQYNDKTTKTDPDYNPDYNTEDYAKEMFWIEHYEKHIEKIKEIYRNCYKTRMDKFSNAVRKMGYDGIIHADEYVVFEPNQIKSVNNNGNWSLEVDNINEEKEVIEERLFPELSDRKYNDLLWFTSPNMTANAYTKFFGKEMIADRIPAKYLVTLSSNDISLKDLVEKHRKLYNAKQVKPIADYKDFNDFITDLNKSKYLSRNDKSNIAKSGAKIIKSFGDWDLYDITTWEAAKKYGSGTTWCVTDSTSDDYFKRYTNRLPFNNYQTEEDMKKSKRSLFYLINPNIDRKMAISVYKRMDYDWYDDEIEFYDEEDEFFYTCRHTSEGGISLKDNIMEKILYFGDDWPDADVIEDYGVTEDFINSVTQFIKDRYRMNKEQIVEDINKLRQKYKHLMNIKESANKSTNMTWEEFVEKVGRINEFGGSVLISKYNTSIIIKQSGRILVRIGKNPYRKAYSKLKTFDEIYNMLVEKGFIEEQILTEGVNQHSLYHGCDLGHAVSMMINNAMRGETIAHINGKQYQGNSLTRSLQVAKDWQEERFDGYGDELTKFWVVLELNKERLKTKYKVLPYNYWEEYFGKDYEHTIDRNGYGDQYEEFVVGRINNLRNYLDDVYLSDECFDVEYAEIFAIVKRELELRGENYTDSQIVKALQTLGINKPSPNDFDSEWNTLNEAHSYYINDVKLYENPSIQWMKKKLNSGTELRILIDGDLREPYFGDWIVWDANEANHQKVLDSLNLYEEDYISVRLCKDSILYWGYTKEKIDKLRECETIQKLYPNGYELISEW